MKTKEEIMRIFEAFDLTGSYRAAAELVGVDHHTVRRYVEVRSRGSDPTLRQRRTRMIDAFMPKIEEMIERSSGRIGAHKVHEKISAMGFTGTSRTTRRAVAAVRASFHAGHRVSHPWVPEPGLWLQWDWGDGPEVARHKSWLWCAWLGWSRFRVVVPVLDKTLPAMARCLDVALRRIGGAPTYVLTAESGGSAEHRTWTPEIGHHYGLIMKTCVTEDARPRAWSDQAARVAARDLVPTDVHAHLASSYRSFGELEEACDAFSAEVNARPLREAPYRPVEALVDETRWLRPLPGELATEPVSP
ncbi:hypothetical protein ACWDFH_29490 [Streptomyces kronopolitis]|uniref:hypothetical protein n=1 Tax=Streptomyces kronopolitis TaxID=1612435 RepID=UPI0036CD5672